MVLISMRKSIWLVSFNSSVRNMLTLRPNTRQSWEVAMVEVMIDMLRNPSQDPQVVLETDHKVAQVKDLRVEQARDHRAELDKDQMADDDVPEGAEL